MKSKEEITHDLAVHIALRRFDASENLTTKLEEDFEGCVRAFAGFYSAAVDILSEMRHF